MPSMLPASLVKLGPCWMCVALRVSGSQDSVNSGLWLLREDWKACPTPTVRMGGALDMTELSGRVVRAATWGCQGRRLGAGTRLGGRAIFA